MHRFFERNISAAELWVSEYGRSMIASTSAYNISNHARDLVHHTYIKRKTHSSSQQKCELAKCELAKCELAQICDNWRLESTCTCVLVPAGRQSKTDWHSPGPNGPCKSNVRAKHFAKNNGHGCVLGGSHSMASTRCTVTTQLLITTQLTRPQNSTDEVCSTVCTEPPMDSQ